MIKKICSNCGSEDILMDAYASWDFDKQEWKLHAIFDKQSVCETCDWEIRIINKEVRDETAT